MHHGGPAPAHSAPSALDSEVSRPPALSAFAAVPASSLEWNSQEDMSRAHDGAMPAASHHVNGQRREAQGPTATLAVMQDMLDSRDAEIGQLRSQLVQAVSAEKERWAATFHSLVATMRPPVQALQQRVQLQEDTIKNLQAELAGRSQPAAAMQALANPLVSDDSPSAEPPADAHAHVHQAAQPGFGGLRASPKRDRPLQQTDADDDCARRARRAPRDRGLGFLPGMKLSNQAE